MVRGKVKHELRVTSSNPRVGSLKARVTQVGRLKAQVEGLKARVRRLKAQIESIKHSEFKIPNFTSYKKSYFHCLANAQLKPHTKVLKNLFHNMTLRKHI